MAEHREKADPPAPRKRALVSCDRCKLRRARCIRDSPDEPCTDCQISGVACESNLPRKQRVYGSIETLSLRFRALESLVKGLFPEENIQDTNTLFRLAASRGISMPANDDFTPADIFRKDGDRRPSEPSYQQTHRKQSRLESAPLPSPQTMSESARSAGTDSSISNPKDTVNNPFVENRQPRRQTEELIPTLHGTPHYFGPSSSFRLATTIRSLVARCKASSGIEYPVVQATSSGNPGGTERASPMSQQQTSTNPSDEEYIVSSATTTQPPLHERKGRKRSRSKMEATDDQWELNRVDATTVVDFLPSRTLGDALVSAYFDHVHIYVPLFHRSMFQYKFESTYARSAETLELFEDIGWLVCLAMVFSFGCRQLQEHDPEQAHKLRMKYLSFAKTYFRQLFSTTCLVNVQALVLLNVHHHTIGQKSSSWLLIGLAARMAIILGMHRDATNTEFDPIERNTRRQVWWSIYCFEKTLCSIMGRPTVIDDKEMTMRIPDAPMLEQKTMSAELMSFTFEVVKLSYNVRQRAYFDNLTAEERSPTLFMAEGLLGDCDNFFATIPPGLSVNHPTVAPEQRARILMLHILYFYARCIVTRDFLIQKVERRISFLEKKQQPYRDDWGRILTLSDDCVESAHKSLRCIIDFPDWSNGYSMLDLFVVFHSILIVCADFLGRPKEQRDSPQDLERKEVVRTVLRIIREVQKLPPTYSTLSRIAMQFAGFVGVCYEPMISQDGQSHTTQPFTTTDRPMAEISDIQEDWFSNATSRLGLDFFDLSQVTDSTAVPHPASDVDDWTARALKGMYDL